LAGSEIAARTGDVLETRLRASEKRQGRDPGERPDSIKAKGAKFGQCTFRARLAALFTNSLFAAFAQFRELLPLGDSMESP
jgi:hypothetical protein